MLHNNIDDNVAPTATLTSTSATATTTATITMAPTETTGNGTEPTISTHLANATATIEPTATTTAPSATEEERNAAAAAAVVDDVVVAASVSPTVEGQAATTMTVTANTTNTNTNTNTNAATQPQLQSTSTETPALSAVAEELPELAKTAAIALYAMCPDDVQMRTQQQHKIKIYHGAKQSAVWRTDSLASNPSPSASLCQQPNSVTSCTEPTKTVPTRTGGYPTAPSLLQRKFSDSSFAATATAMPRRVSFPESDKELVTGYLEPANPWEQVCQVSSIAEISQLYVQSCYKHCTKPKKNIQDHLKSLDLSLTRQPLLSLKGIELTPNDCEPLEEIFKRIQYKVIDLSECVLNESCLSALCQMIEYYEAANELDISYNRDPMTVRGWNLCTYMVGRSQELQLLNAEGNQISKVGAENLGHALSTSNLHTLKLEHCGLKGPPLTSFYLTSIDFSYLGYQLYHNKILKELWLGYNDLDCTDAEHIAGMLRFNYNIELIDISNNNIRDDGVKYLVQALIMQASDLERRSALPLQRARAIEDDEPISPVETIAPVSEQTDEASSAKQAETETFKEVEQQPAPTPVISAAAAAIATEEPSASEPPVAVLVDLENDADDDNTEDTVRTLRSGNQSATGQSMLDKLLSMNSDSSSEEAPSNISTDTLAACCSEDISELSNDLYDASSKSLVTSTAAATASIDESLATPASSEATALDSSLEQLAPAQQQQQQSSQNERNLCDITPSTEAKTVEPNETCVQNNNSSHNNNNSNSNSNSNCNSNNNNNNQAAATAATAAEIAVVAAVAAAVPVAVDVSSSGSGAGTIFEVTAEESDCINGGSTASGSRPLDMNKNAAKANGDDFEDTHSTDSAFESASEGDISRHLPDEFSRLSVSLESTRLDDLAKEMAIETATIASESTECLLVAAEEAAVETATATTMTTIAMTPKVTIAAECLTGVKDKEASASPCPSPTPTPPPPSTSPGGVSSGLRRTESSCAYLNQSTRNRSQSSDSLCSENSLDGSTSAADPHLAEKLTKNDTLSRARQPNDPAVEPLVRAPSGLKALALWSNNLTKNCAPSIAELLSRSSSLELLNIGKNCLSNDFVATIKDSLTKNTTLTTLGLQSAHLSAKGIETLASILTFGGNSKLQRIDIRDNKLEVESLNIIAEVLKSNKTITQIDINDEPKRLTLPIVPIVNVIPPTPLPQESIGSDAHLDYTRVLGTVRSMCSRNEKMQAEELELAEKAANVGGGSSSSSSSNNGGNNQSNSNNIGSNNSGISQRCRGGYYLGSRKISLTCHSRPLVDAATGTVMAATAATPAVTTAMPTPAAKLEVKRRASSSSSRLRSPGPSPPTVSPSSSPNRSRFHVSRVAELSSPATSPLAQMPPHPPHPPPTTPRSASSCMSIPAVGSQSSLNAIAAALPLPTSSSLPSMASVTSSTQTIKRLSVSPRSRFHVCRIYEDPQTPPIHLPPTPMLKSARKAAAQLAEMTSATPVTVTATTTDALPISSVIIVEPVAAEAAQPASTTHEEEEQQKLSPQCSVNSPSTSSSSCSSSPISSSATNSSSSSDVTTDSSDTAAAAAAATVPAKSCPIAVFGDNDITLTKDSAAGVALSAAASSQDVTSTTTTTATATAAAAPAQPRARKSSWIANPTTVDKLLTLFNPSSMFQRSSSPETKTNAAVPASTVAAAPLTSNAQNTTTTTTVLGASGDVNVTLLPTRKTTPPARSNSYAIGSGSTGGAAAATGGSGAAEAAAGGSSFLDNASRQLRDFGKQVFRQNLSFNSGDGMMSMMSSGSSQLEANNASGTTVMSPVAESATPPECNAMHMPLSLKRELKENISPEHTINEETLHTLQKLSRAAEDVTLKAEAAAELGDIEIVMHSEVSDCLPEAEQVQPEDAGQV
ncbi:hypothetical protein KR044_005951 [Drosophila immigrans]|nr:hypothetical protein KR044_005951 [Drosophila immigrans]